MDRNFQRALSLVLKYEGGYVNHKDDPGGPTNKGITLATFRRYIEPKGTIADLKAITAAQVATVYRRQYWDAVKGDDLPDGVDFATFDFAVNSGPSRAAKYLQSVLGVTQDGKIGPGTLAAAKASKANVTVNVLCDARMAFLKRLKTWKTFGKGWSSRVSSVRVEALKMTAAEPIVVVVPVPVPTPAPPSPETTEAAKAVGLWAAISTLLANLLKRT